MQRKLNQKLKMKNCNEQAGAELGQAQPQAGFEVRIWSWGVKMQIENVVQRLSLTLTCEVEEKLKLKFENDVWSWSLNLKFEVEIWS